AHPDPRRVARRTSAQGDGEGAEPRAPAARRLASGELNLSDRRVRGPSGSACGAGPAQARELELRVERLTYGPDSLARAGDGRVVFLDRGLPGERVRARLTELRRDCAGARVIETIEPSHATGDGIRRTPPCPIVERCGGCPWQHITYTAQLEAKLEVALREIGRAA